MSTRIGDYDIVREIGHGGFGRVYLAVDPRMRRQVAIKVLTNVEDRGLIERFQQEAVAAGNLDHPNIVIVHGCGEHQGRPYIVMEHLEGQDLHHVIEEEQGSRKQMGLLEKMNLLQKVELMWGVAEGLQCAHDHEVIHRDIKPANIKVLPDGKPKILDFGIAKIRNGSGHQTQGNVLIGTISYMAPELFAGHEADRLCDIWSYGVIYYELLSGVQPFRLPDVPAPAIMNRIMTVDPAPLGTLVPGCSEALEWIVHKLLNRNPEHRYQSLEDVQFDVAPVLKELRSQRAAELLANAQALVAENRLDSLEGIVRQILELDPANAEGRKLREKLKHESHRKRIAPKVTALLQQAEAQVEERDFAAAMHSVETALKLSPDDSSILTFKNRIQATVDKIQKASALADQAREALSAGDFATASRLITAALSADRDNKTAQATLDDIRATMDAHEKTRKLRNELSRAETFFGMDALQEAEALLDRLAKEHPGSPDVEALFNRVRSKRRDDTVMSALRYADEQMQAGRWRDAILRLEVALVQYPDAAEVAAKLTMARERLALSIRDEYCRQVAQEVEGLLDSGKSQQSLQVLAQALRRYPNQLSLTNLQRQAEARKAEQEKAKRIEDALLQCAELQQQSRLAEARGMVKALIQNLGQTAQLISFKEQLDASILEATNRALDRAASLAREKQFVEAAGVLQEASQAVGEDSRLQDLLRSVKEQQRELERLREIGAALHEAEAAEGRGDYAAALIALAECSNSIGPCPELQQASAGIRKRQEKARHEAAIRKTIRAETWQAAEERLAQARESLPDEPLWATLAVEVRDGKLLRDLEALAKHANVSSSGRMGLRQQLKQARRLQPAATGLDPFIAGLHCLQIRTRQLQNANRHLQYERLETADALLQQMLAANPQDPEVLRRLNRLQALQEQARRRAEIAQKHAAAAELFATKQYREAEAAFEELLQLEPADPSLASELERVRAERHDAEIEKSAHATLQSAEELTAHGVPVPEAMQALDLVDSWVQKSRDPASGGLAGIRTRAEVLRQAWTAFGKVEHAITFAAQVGGATKTFVPDAFTEAQASLNAAQRLYPKQAALWIRAEGLYRSSLTSAVEYAFDARDLFRAVSLLDTAALLDPPLADIEDLRAQFAKLQGRAKSLQRLVELQRTEQFAQAAPLVAELAESYPNDEQVQLAIQALRNAQQAAERKAKQEHLLASAQQLRDKDDLDAASAVLQELLEAFPENYSGMQALDEVKQELQRRREEALRLQQEQQRLQQEADLREQEEARQRREAERLRLEEEQRLLEAERQRQEAERVEQEAERIKQEAERRLQQRQLDIQTICRQASSLLPDQPGVAAELLRSSIERLGSDADLERSLHQATAILLERQRIRDIAECVTTAAVHRQAQQFDAAQAALSVGMERFGPDPELEAARIELVKYRNRLDQVADIERLLSQQDWDGAETALRSAETAHPDEGAWPRFRTGVQHGRLREAWNAALAQHDTDRLQALLLEALEVTPTVVDIDTWEIELHAEEHRAKQLAQVGALRREAKFAEAHLLLQDLLTVRRQDIELAGLLEEVSRQKLEQERQRLEEQAALQHKQQEEQAALARKQQEEQEVLQRKQREEQAARERQQRIDQALTKAATFRAAGDLDTAIDLLDPLHKEFPDDPQLWVPLRALKADREQLRIQKQKEEGRAEAVRLLQKGETAQAIRKYRALLKRFPEDAGLLEETEKVEAEAKAAEVQRQAEEAQRKKDEAELKAKGEKEAAELKARRDKEEVERKAKLAKEAAALKAQREKEAAELKARQEKAEAERKADEVRRKVDATRKQTDALIAERRFDDAVKLLEPLIEQFPQEHQLKDLWRSATAARGNRADWLEVHEELTEIEELRSKGKAAQVRRRAQKILARIEEPRARKHLEWAEQMLGKDTAAKDPKSAEELAEEQNPLRRLWKNLTGGD